MKIELQRNNQFYVYDEESDYYYLIQRYKKTSYEPTELSLHKELDLTFIKDIDKILDGREKNEKES
jgi:hypothetical protein